MKKIYMILIAVILIASAIALTSCRNNATDIIPNDTTPEGLPPDPGEEGLETVGGIDSDNDGVRDDPQRFIAQEIESKTAQAILTDYAKNVQKYMVSDEELKNMEEEIIADFSSDITVDCLYAEDPDNAYDIITKMEGILLNTGDRLIAASRAYSLYNKRTPNTLTANEIAVACEKYSNR
ncbi:hypothetical protein KAS08_00335 [Candidatus Pacearchaeota archaeon]|nr:hypothetical protein [Candidatus Pacearchaeota archaeon]